MNPTEPATSSTQQPPPTANPSVVSTINTSTNVQQPSVCF